MSNGSHWWQMDLLHKKIGGLMIEDKMNKHETITIELEQIVSELLLNSNDNDSRVAGSLSL